MNQTMNSCITRLMVVVAVSALATCIATSAGAALLNDDFEIDNTGDPNFGWITYGSAGVNDFFGGNGHGSLFTDGDQFSGVFQDIVGLAGTEYEFSLNDVRIEENAFDDLLFGIEFWSGGSKITEILKAIPEGGGAGALDGYSDSVTATAPASTDTIRVIFKLDRTELSVEPTSQSGVFVFDSSLAIVPEPATLMLAGGGLLALTLRRRRG